MFFNGVVNAANKKCAILVEDPGLHVKDRRTECVCVWGRLKVLTSPSTKSIILWHKTMEELSGSGKRGLDQD